MHIPVLVRALGVAAGGLMVLRWSYSLLASQRVLPDKLVTTSGLLFVILIDMYRLKPGGDHTIRSLVKQYLYNKSAYVIGTLMARRLQKLCKDVGQQQEDLLKTILEANRETQVLQHFQIQTVKSVKEYRQKLKLTTYEDYKPFSKDVQENGSSNVFFPGHVDFIAMTSGTTSGDSKAISKSMQVLRKATGKWLMLSQKCILDVKGNNYLRKWLAVRVSPNTWLSHSGIRTGPISALASNYSMNPYVVPHDTNTLSDEQDVIYINLVFGLKTSEICNLFFTTSQMALVFFQTMEQRWEELCNDIEHGELTKNLNQVPESIRHSLSRKLHGSSPLRARQLRQEFRKGFAGIVPRLWPDCPALFCLGTGSFQTQADLIRNRYLDHVPLFSPYHAATETFYGLNLDYHENDTSYTATTMLNFFEFVHRSNVHETNPATVLCHQVKIGEQYELVVTTLEGLYRYRTEDLVEITGFTGTIPKYKFIGRTCDVLSTDVERVPENLLYRALKTSSVIWNTPIVEYVSTESIHLDEKAERKYYVVFLELQNGVILSDSDKAMVDKELLQLHEIYSSYRQNNKMRSVRVIQVRPGTFARLANQIMKDTACSVQSQFKLPRIIRQPTWLKTLLSEIMAEV